MVAEERMARFDVLAFNGANMSEERSGFPWILVTVLLCVLLIGAFFAFPVLRIFPMVFLSVHQIKRQEAKMQSPKVCSQVGHSLAVYCQTGSAIFPTGFVGNAWLPKAERELDTSFSRLTETNAHIMMGGGFHHYGYSLERQPLFTEKSNLWTLTFCSEGSDPKLLSTFSTLSSETIPVSSFVADTLAEYDRLSKTKQDEVNALWLEQRRVAFLIQFDRAKVREACLKAIEDLPKHWWPRLTLAFIDSAGGRYEHAAQELARWAGFNPSYSRYLYLAYYYQEMGKPDQAAEAIEKAIKCPIVDLADDLSNTECRGYSAGLYAFQVGKYATVIKLCDALLPVKENGDYAKGALGDLRRAAVSAQSGAVPAFQSDDHVLRFNPYEHVSLDALLSL